MRFFHCSLTEMFLKDKSKQKSDFQWSIKKGSDYKYCNFQQFHGQIFSVRNVKHAACNYRDMNAYRSLLSTREVLELYQVIAKCDSSFLHA